VKYFARNITRGISALIKARNLANSQKLNVLVSARACK